MGGSRTLSIFRDFYGVWGCLGAPRSLDPSLGILGTCLYGYRGIRLYVCIQKRVYAYKHMGCEAFFLLHCNGYVYLEVYRAVRVGGHWPAAAAASAIN